MLSQLSSVASRLLFLVALVLAGLVAWEMLANLMGRTLTFLADESRLLGMAAVALLFVIAMELRDIKHRTEGGRSG
jgi:hypothetical protein